MRGPNGSYEDIDFRETAPAAAFEDMYVQNENLSLYGGLARYVAVQTFMLLKSLILLAAYLVSCVVSSIFIKITENFHGALRCFLPFPSLVMAFS